MSLRVRLDRIERRLPARGFGHGGTCPDCGWPAPDRREWPGITIANLETLRAAYTAAEARRRQANANGKGNAPPAAGCPRCGVVADLYRYFSDAELDAAGEIMARSIGRVWPHTGEELDAELAALRAELAQDDGE